MCASKCARKLELGVFEALARRQSVEAKERPIVKEGVDAHGSRIKISGWIASSVIEARCVLDEVGGKAGR